MSAVGAGVLVLGASGVYAVQMDESAPSPLDLTTVADSDAWARGSGAEQVIRYRIRLRGPGTDARLAVLTTPAEALRGIECPEETRSSTPLPKGAGVCMVGALPAEGGSVDVLLALPERPRDLTVSALARMSGPDGKMVSQRAQNTIKSTDAVMRRGGDAAEVPETLEHARVTRESRPAEPRGGVGAPGAASMVLKVPQTAEESGEAPLGAPRVSEAQRAEQRMSAFLLDLAGKAFVAPPVSGPGAGANAAGAPADQGTSRGAGVPVNPLTRALPGAPGATGGPAASHETRGTVPGGRGEAGSPVAPARVPDGEVPGRPAAPLPPGGSAAPLPPGRPAAPLPPDRHAAPLSPGRPQEGTRLPDGAAVPGAAAQGAAPEAGAAVPGRGAAPGQGAAAIPPAGAPEPPAIQGQNGRNHSATGAQTGRKAAGRKVRGQRHAAGRPGAREQGVNPQALLRQTGPGRQTVGLPGVPQMGPGQPVLPQMGPGLEQMGPLYPGYPGNGKKTAGGPGSRRPMVGPMPPGYPGIGQPAVPGQGMGQPMPPGYPGIGQPGMAGQPGVPQQGPGGPVGGPMAPGGPGVGQQPGGPQTPGIQPGVPGAMTPPISMGMAGAGQMPGLANGLQLPQAGPFPAAQVPVSQDSGPQGAPLPQDLDGPSGQVQPVSESSPLLTGATGLPAVGAGVGTLLGLLWLQRRIQRRRRSRHVL
ncbi:hypothetical protein [Streptosporangium sp. NPDC006930]|uniref:hypothetical protein n=1 Tax=Streptosporangium sp. NPDC006930 TaxID=3154783 RepID=UPI003447ACC5